MTKVTAQLNNLRISPRKVRLVADEVRGESVGKAIAALQYDLRKPAAPMQKLLKSAVANAEHNYKLSSEELYISEITVGEGPTLKRWMPRAYGRASKILKRTSRIRIVLSPEVSNLSSKKKDVKASNDKKEAKVKNKSEDKSK